MLLRVDFNEPIANGQIQDDFKIRANRETIDYLANSGAKLLLVTHHSDKQQSFKQITSQISNILEKEIVFLAHLSDWDGQKIALLENVRQFAGEDENDNTFAQSLTTGFDLYVNDAFSECHRVRASVSGITQFLPSYAGLLVKKEIGNLSRVIEAPIEGKVLVIGGAKIATKLPVIENFLTKSEKILVGGALANNFFKARGIRVGASLVDETAVSEIDTRIVVLPQDIVITSDRTGRSGDARTSVVRNIETNEIIADIGPQSAEIFAEIIQQAKLVIWNGPMGLAEVPSFAKGTELVARAVARADQSVVGGGDTIAALNQSGLLEKVSFVSTGGGAMLAFLAGEKLPGLAALNYY